VAQFPGNTAPTVLVDQFSGGAEGLGAIEAFHPAGHEASWAPTGTGYVGGWSLASVEGQLVIKTGSLAYIDGPWVLAGYTVDLLQFHGTAFVDVTREFPKHVASDAGRLWGLFVASHGENQLAAWVADECLLGKKASAFAVVARVRARHQLKAYGGFAKPVWKWYLEELKAVCSEAPSRR